MSRMIPSAERLIRARKLIQKARDLPNPAENGGIDFAYVAQVMDLLQQARDLIKFISYTPTATPEMKADVNQIYQEVDQAEKEILHR